MYGPLKNEANKLRRYDIPALLHAISRTSTSRFKDQVPFDQALRKMGYEPIAALRDYQLAFVIRLAVESYDKPRLSPRKLDVRSLAEMCGLVTKYQSPSEYPVIDTDADSAHRLMIRMAYQQFGDFVNEHDRLARTYLLYKECAQQARRKVDFDVEGRFAEATGLTLEQLWDLTLALLGLMLTTGGGLIPGPLMIGDLDKSVSQAQLDRYLGMVGAKLDYFSILLHDASRKLDLYETFNPNPLFDKPVLRLNGDKWVIPIPRYLLERATSGIFYDLIGRYGRGFAGYFGYVFEEYVDKILSVLPPDYEVVPEFRYHVEGRPFDSCDRIILGHGDALLIECKTKRLKVDTKSTAEEARLRRDLTDQGTPDGKSSVVAGIRQLNRFLNHMRQDVPDLRSLASKLTGKVYAAVLVLDPYYFVNAPYMRRIIDEELAKGKDPVNSFDYQIFDITGLETICVLAGSESFFTLLEKKFHEEPHQSSDLKSFMDQLHKEAEKGIQHPALQKAMESFWSELGSRYGRAFGDPLPTLSSPS